MINNLHRWLLLRLAVVWLVLSLVSGGLVQQLGHARLDDHILQMAKAETSKYTAELIEYFHSPSEQAFALFNRRIHAAIEKDNFVVVRLNDTDLNQIAEVTKSPAAETEVGLFLVVPPCCAGDFCDKHCAVPAHHSAQQQTQKTLSHSCVNQRGYAEGAGQRNRQT